MDPTQLRIFLTVAEELHFGRAAERLHLAQPPVSRTVKQLERELGATLFKRNTRSVTLTSVGRALVEPAREALDAMERVKLTARFARTGEVGRVCLAFATASWNVMVGKLARGVKQAHPGIQLDFLSQRFAQASMKLLTDGRVDIALGWWDHIPTGIESRVLAVEELVVAVPETHRLADRERVSIRDFDGESFVSLSPETGTLLLDRLRELTATANLGVTIAQYVSNSWTATALVSADVGCSLTLPSVVESITDPHLRMLRLSDPIAPVERRIAWRAANDDRAVHTVLKLSESVLPTPGTHQAEVD
ncbi:LysR family transcriptional regulator [Amycolatopsis sp. NPDC051903]|uniref:LysR family transcriptional regulator n=1 Tax=Amycolatopsis sp. NPDC051903 TaxID=3363936 RepID=UPI003791D465